MKIKGLSASSFNCYSMCQWKWYLTYELGFEDRSGPAAILGHIAHSMFETISEAVMNNVPLEDPVYDVEAQWNKWFDHYFLKDPELASQIQPAKLKKLCTGIHDLFNGEYSPIRDNTIGVEQYFREPIEKPEFKLGDSYFTIRGLIDRVDKIDDETVEIVDYKTGQRKPFGKGFNAEPYDVFSLREEIQPRMYHYAAKRLYPWAKTVLVTFIYLIDGGPLMMPFSDDDIVETEEKIKKRFLHIKNNEDPDRNKSFICRFCNFDKSKTGVCDDVWREKEEAGMQFVSNKYGVINCRERR